MFLLILFPRLFSVRKLKWHCKIHENIINKNKGYFKNSFILTLSGFRNKSLTPSWNEDSINDISTRNWIRLIFGHHRFDVGLKRKKKYLFNVSFDFEGQLWFVLEFRNRCKIIIKHLAIQVKKIVPQKTIFKLRKFEVSCLHCTCPKVGQRFLETQKSDFRFRSDLHLSWIEGSFPADLD